MRLLCLRRTSTLMIRFYNFSFLFQRNPRANAVCGDHFCFQYSLLPSFNLLSRKSERLVGFYVGMMIILGETKNNNIKSVTFGEKEKLIQGFKWNVDFRDEKSK